MAKSQALRLAEIRRAFRIVGDCRERGHNLDAWVSLANRELRASVGSVMSCAAYAHSAATVMLPTPGVNLWDDGWSPTEPDRVHWLGFLREKRYFHYPTTLKLFAMPGRLFVRSRPQFIKDDEWYASSELNDDRRLVGQDDTLVGLHRFEGSTGQIAFSLNRLWGERPFEPRDRAFVRLVLEELFALPESKLTRDPRGPLATLPPRLRQVLLALAEGDSEKQVALRLGLSRHTVHDLVKELHRRFQVSSRGELLNAYHRRIRHP